MKISKKKFALQLPKQDFYSFKLFKLYTVDKVHANRHALIGANAFL